MKELSIKDMSSIMETHLANVQKQMDYDKAHPEEVKKRKTPYWEVVNPTYIENWPTELMNLSIPSIDIPLLVDDCDRINSNNGEFSEGYDIHANIDDIIVKVDNAVKQFPNGAFIRLGSRSPKDSYVAYDNQFKCYSGLEAMAQLCGSSERIYEDLELAKIMGYNPHVFIREFIDIPVWSEFRCFVENKHLIGICQYNYFEKRQDEIVNNADSIEWAIKTAFSSVILPALHLYNVVCDVFVKKRTHGNETHWDVRLLEINPHYPLTDPCMFKWVNDSITNITINEPGKFLYYT